MFRVPGRLALPLLIVPALALGAWWWTAAARGPAPPAIESLGEMDPDVAAFLGELRTGIERDRGDAQAWARFAMASEANGFVGAARQAYERATALAPGDARLHYRLALVTSRLGRPAEALAILERVNQLAPDYAPAWSRRGAWLLDRGDLDEAQRAFERAQQVDSADLAAAFGLARVHLARRDHARAAQLLERLLESHPGDRYALQLLGTAYRRLGRLDDARFALAVGASGEPSWRDPWSEEVGEYRRGFATMLKSATAEAMAGRFDRALPLLEELRRRRPDDIALANHTSGVLTAAGRPADAIRLLNSMGGTNAETQLALASAYLAAGDFARAEAHADRAIALEASGARAYELKGTIAWRGGRRRDASRLFERGLARDPREVKLLAAIGLIDLEEGRARDAVAAFGEVLRRDPLQPDALAGLAMAQHALGHREEAALALTRAEQVAAGHPRVRQARAQLEAPARP